jgi:VWFA-related protein
LLLVALSLLPAIAAKGHAQRIEVENECGSVTIRSAMGVSTLKIHTAGALSERPSPVESTSGPDGTRVWCREQNGNRVDLDITVPHTAVVRARVKQGELRLVGLVRWASVDIEQGKVGISAPLLMTRIRIVADEKLRAFRAAKVAGVRYVTGKRNGLWAIADVDSRALFTSAQDSPIVSSWTGRRPGTFATVEVRARSATEVVLEDRGIDPNAWILPPSLARDVVRARRPMGRPPSGVSPGADSEAGLSGAGPVFRSEVRLVTLQVPVYDRLGQPLAGLSREEVRVIEGGQEQEIALLTAEETPVDWMLLLDLSESTVRSRDAMIDIAKGFVHLATDKDRVSIYAIAEDLFQVIAPLSSDRTELQQRLAEIPFLQGRTPLYDAIALACHWGQGPDRHRRTAMIVLTDGYDSALPPFPLPGGSAVSIAQLRSYVSESPVLLYPIILPSSVNPNLEESSATKNLRALAEASDGQAFSVTSMTNIASLYSTVERALRSVYTIGYYPKNQKFDGRWRATDVKLSREGVIRRARRGYFGK